MAFIKGSAFSPSAALHSETSALECTPVMAALRQAKFNPILWLACRAARHSSRAVNAEHVPVRLEPAGRSPCACSLGVSFISRSARLALESSDFLSFLTHLMGLSERSEEHTSELQSRLHLVCRLLLEKKKTIN